VALLLSVFEKSDVYSVVIYSEDFAPMSNIPSIDIPALASKACDTLSLNPKELVYEEVPVYENPLVYVTFVV